ncbi:sigma factor-like helix-turn-helix DNA-binding protein [Amycolatopsis sp. NPDC049688]|uniref:sigma factor-like helix-turn-helix DNA-binding protein n=1 Tax=Amycolatopsis sp. NPDC049688 TaxID=3154733 RepID=UPI00341AAEA4
MRSPGIADIRLTADQLRRGDEQGKAAGEQLVRAGLARLWQRDRESLLMRLGLTTGATTMAEIAQQFGLSRERIRQVQRRELDRALVTAEDGVRIGTRPAIDCAER